MSVRHSVLGLLGFILGTAVSASAAEEQAAAGQILNATAVKGGVIVHVGCGDGKLTAALRANDGFLVHGLDAEAKSVEAARKHIQSLGLYGPVSADRFDGRRLPYIDNLINLVVAEDLGSVSHEELMRVLCPNGVAYVKRQGQWTKIVKPRPPTIDEWTHYLHDPTNNAVAHDTVVGPPRHLQWVAGPKWSRHHDHMSSSSAIVSAGGRNFYIFDDANAASIQLPSRWFLIARDAFNGLVLWKRPISRWWTQMWRLKSGPAQLPRRLVAVGDRVYVTLSIDAPVSALDAASGRTIRTYEATRATEEILVDDGVLYLVVNESPTKQAPSPRDFDYDFREGPRAVMAVRADDGKVLWKKPCRWIAPLTLTVDAQRVLLYDGEKILCLDRKTGADQWQVASVGRRSFVPSYFGPNLVSHEGVILFAGGEVGKSDYHMDNGIRMTALDAASGKVLWEAPHPMGGYRSPEDILVLQGLVWCAPLFMGTDTGIFTGRDLRTGAVKVEFPPDVKTHWFHHRCYRAKATDRYILTSRTGIEFVDVAARHWLCHHWVRGACLYGILPANGMVYTSPHPCACYLEAKLFGFNALAPTSPSRQIPRNVPDEGRLERGPAYTPIPSPPSPIPSSDDWPTYRRDNRRSGYLDAAVPAGVKPAWQTKLGGRLSSPVIAGGQVLVAAVDAHAVHALDARSGKPIWCFTAGARVDSPPTVWQGRVLFGSADGWVYSLRASDGALQWRFRVAPIDRRLMAFEQLESVWPVHGSVLVEDGVAWCVAGRSMFLDGGLRLVRLDARTGKKLSEAVFDDRDPDSGENLQVRLKGLNMPVALADIMSSDGRYVYMRSQRFDRDGRRLEIDAPTLPPRQQQGEGAHLFCPTGFLDDAYWHRSYWVYGLRWASGAGGYFLAGRFAPSGRLLVFDDSTVYGFSRKPQYFRWTTPIERQLFASSKQPEILPGGEAKTEAGAKAKPGRQGKRQPAAEGKAKAAPEGKTKPARKFNANQAPNARIAYQWTQPLPLHVRAMVLAGRTIFVAGPPDLVDEEEAVKNFADPAVQAKLAEQSAALDGRHGALLLAVSAASGEKLAEHKLAALPVFDGMAAAGGRLYLALADGSVLCFGPAK